MSKLPQHVRARKKEIVESDGPWMIWSRYHNLWHRRSREGGAAGYTSDILQAGVWADTIKPTAYNNDRDRPIPLKALLPQIKQQGRDALRRAYLADCLESQVIR